MMHPIDCNKVIPPTKFTEGFIIQQLNQSSNEEWIKFVGKYGSPKECQIDILSGKGYLSSVNRLTFRCGNEEFRVVLKVPTVSILESMDKFDSKNVKYRHILEYLMKVLVRNKHAVKITNVP